MAAFGEQVQTLRRQEQVQQELEHCADDMDRCLPPAFEWIPSSHPAKIGCSASCATALLSLWLALPNLPSSQLCLPSSALHCSHSPLLALHVSKEQFTPTHLCTTPTVCTCFCCRKSRNTCV